MDADGSNDDDCSTVNIWNCYLLDVSIEAATLTVKSAATALQEMTGE